MEEEETPAVQRCTGRKGPVVGRCMEVVLPHTAGDHNWWAVPEGADYKATTKRSERWALSPQTSNRRA